MKNNLDGVEVHNGYKVAAFYSFSPIEEDLISLLIKDLQILAQKYDVRGTILIALEGVNGTICGPVDGVNSIYNRLKSLNLESPFEVKFSFTSKHAFRRFKIRRKKEIVTMGVMNVNPHENVGKYVEPEDWNTFIDDASTLVIDTRNEYEVAIGTFKGAINPHIDTFREFPAWVDQNLRPLLQKGNYRKIAMFCTGGIRCEKSTSLLKLKNFPEVHHLHGGILRYLAEVPQQNSRWEGECFVFDQRVAVDHDLKPGVHRLCFACGRPLSPKDRKNMAYIPGIQCEYCKDFFSDSDRERFKERQKHIKELEQRLPGNTLWPSA